MNFVFCYFPSPKSLLTMVRIKQGKSAASASQSKVAKKPGKRIREDVLKANVLALGGDAGDLEIIQNVRDDVGGNSNPPHDVRE